MTLVLKSGYSFDSDASTYIDAVETADGEALETGVRIAINDFVLGCKQDGIWDAIKASCILAGARTLDGALVPLVGTAPTKQGTEVDWNYNRVTGLQGNGTNNYLDSNRANNADPQNNNHNAIYLQTAGTATAAYLGVTITTGGVGTNDLGRSSSIFFRNRSNIAIGTGSVNATGLIGMSRQSSASFVTRVSGSNTTASTVSETPNNGNISIFATGAAGFPTDARFAFYSIGEFLDLTLLDARVSNLITAIGGAI